MKKNYGQPMLFVETFLPNVNVATCNVNKGIDYTFDCLRGTEVDLGENVISTGFEHDGTCTNNVGYQSGCRIGRNYNKDKDWGSSENSITPTISRDFKVVNSSYMQVTYTGGVGLLYVSANDKYSNATSTIGAGWSFNSSDNAMEWNPTSTQVRKHVMVAPLVSTTSVNASW